MDTHFGRAAVSDLLADTDQQTPPSAAAPPRAGGARWHRLAPLGASLVLAFLTIGATQWEQLTTNLPRRSTFGAYRFAPSGNEWRMRRKAGFGADEFDLRRTFTVNEEVDPLADAKAAFADFDHLVPTRMIPDRAARRDMVRWRFRTYGWPMRHAGVDQLGRRRILPLGFTVNMLLATPVWFGVLHLMRAPVAWVIGRFRAPPWACPKCRYDLRGLPEDVPCPECGRAREPAG
jgi:hypothetical protein